MNEVLTALKTRRSIRKFRPDPIPQALLDEIMEAGLYAASGMDRQQSIILCITEPDVIVRLSRANAQIAGYKEGTDPFYGAPAVLVVLSPKEVPTALYDGTLVLANLMTAAHALGLGSCWIHRAREEFEQPAWQDFLRKLDLTGDYIGIGHCVIGYPDEHPEASPRRSGRIIYVGKEKR
ncbi:MAG: nitroreductase [Acidaminococcus sp.]|uniref:Nitroreductase n=1 Tax=Acidaminococcus intestini TaxID=187327 RepID=A0A943EFZ7_9FIRM|nr:nitroreductase [Acidaminococcus sp.]MBS5520405.1 nitroreductase [Acidaminococcus intestini]MDY2738245.1 nitroreductase [Acidaminococcus sp.]